MEFLVTDHSSASTCSIHLVWYVIAVSYGQFRFLLFFYFVFLNTPTFTFISVCDVTTKIIYNLICKLSWHSFSFSEKLLVVSKCSIFTSYNFKRIQNYDCQKITSFNLLEIYRSSSLWAESCFRNNVYHFPLLLVEGGEAK